MKIHIILKCYEFFRRCHEQGTNIAGPIQHPLFKLAAQKLVRFGNLRRPEQSKHGEIK